jgi:hypothetical protein
MGYRSTVAYTIRFIPRHSPDTDDIEEERKAKSSFYLLLAEAKANVNTALCFSEKESDVFKVIEEDLELRFFAEGVKWYETYPDVACHEALIELSKSWVGDDTSNPYVGGAFARVGEDANDNVEEIWGQGEYSWVGVNRSVYADWYE